MVNLEKMSSNSRYGSIAYKIIDKKLVGRVYGNETSIKNKKCFEITWIHIPKTQRRKGYGKFAVNKLKEKYKCLKAKGVGGPNKKVALAFWKSLKFRKIPNSTKNYIYNST